MFGLFASDILLSSVAPFNDVPSAVNRVKGDAMQNLPRYTKAGKIYRTRMVINRILSFSNQSLWRYIWWWRFLIEHCRLQERGRQCSFVLLNTLVLSRWGLQLTALVLQSELLFGNLLPRQISDYGRGRNIIATLLPIAWPANAEMRLTHRSSCTQSSLRWKLLALIILILCLFADSISGFGPSSSKSSQACQGRWTLENNFERSSIFGLVVQTAFLGAIRSWPLKRKPIHKTNGCYCLLTDKFS